jgi:hypothetical protein
MTKLNLKVVDMENTIVDFAKSVSHNPESCYSYSKSTPLLRITVRRDSLPTRSERPSTSNKVRDSPF